MGERYYLQKHHIINKRIESMSILHIIMFNETLYSFLLNWISRVLRRTDKNISFEENKVIEEQTNSNSNSSVIAIAIAV